MELLASRIEAVTVFASGAQVTRVAPLAHDGNAYPARVRLEGLPLSLVDGSVEVRVEGEATPGAAELPIASDLRIGLAVPTPESSLRPPESLELVGARQDEQRLAAQIAQIERERGRWRELVVPTRPKEKGAEAPADLTEARLALVGLRAAEMQRLLGEKHAVGRWLREARRLREQLEEQERLATSARQAKAHELRKCVDVSLRRCHAAPGARLVLVYQVPGARWAPAYTARLDPGMTAGSFALRAVVAQQTGEDWRDVALTLSTADRLGWTELPELSSLRIGRRQPAPKKTGWRPPPTGVEALYEPYDRAVASVDGGPPAATPASVSAGAVPGGPMAGDLGALPRELQAALDAKLKEAEVELDEAIPDAEPMEFEESREEEMAISAADEAPMEPSGLAVMASRPAASAANMAMPAAPTLAPHSEMAKSDRRSAPMARAKKASGREAERDRRNAKTKARPPGGGGGAVAEEDGLEGGLTAAEAMMAYGDLRLPAPGAPRRGHLVLTRRRERYLAVLEEQRVTLSFNLDQVLGEAEARAMAVGQRELPRGFSPPARRLGFDYAYAADGRVDIPSDPTFHNVALARRESDLSLRYVVVPRETLDAFRFVRMANPFSAPILPGPADIYLGDEFLLTTPLGVAAPNGVIELGLGVEQAIKVSRNTHFAEGSAGLMGGTTELRHEIAIEIANHTPGPVEVEVRERVPVIREKEEDIEVAVAAVEPPWEPYDQEKKPLEGGFRWQLHLTAGETCKLAATYAIKLPAKYELVGGNRRED